MLAQLSDGQPQVAFVHQVPALTTLARCSGNSSGGTTRRSDGQAERGGLPGLQPERDVAAVVGHLSAAGVAVVDTLMFVWMRER